MTENLRESISALMDNEASEIEMHRVLKSIESDDEVRSTWRRYQLASFTLKRQLNNSSLIDISVDISAQIAEAIALEAVPGDVPAAIPASGAQTFWGKVAKPMTSLAVAASVAFMVIFGALQIEHNSVIDPQAGFAENTNVPQINTTGLPLNGVQTVAAGSSSSETLTPSQRRLRELMSKHAQQADLLRGRGVMPYVQMVDMQETRD